MWEIAAIGVSLSSLENEGFTSLGGLQPRHSLQSFCFTSFRAQEEACKLKVVHFCLELGQKTKSIFAAVGFINNVDNHAMQTKAIAICRLIVA